MTQDLHQANIIIAQDPVHHTVEDQGQIDQEVGLVLVVHIVLVPIVLAHTVLDRIVLDHTVLDHIILDHIVLDHTALDLIDRIVKAGAEVLLHPMQVMMTAGHILLIFKSMIKLVQIDPVHGRKVVADHVLGLEHQLAIAQDPSQSQDLAHVVAVVKADRNRKVFPDHVHVQSRVPDPEVMGQEAVVGQDLVVISVREKRKREKL